MPVNPYNHDVEDQHAELVAALVEAFAEECGDPVIERLAQVAVDVMCDNTNVVLDLISDVDEWIAALRFGSDADAIAGPYDYRTGRTK